MSIWKEQHENEVVLSRRRELFPELNHVTIDIRLSSMQWGRFLEQHSQVLQDLSIISFRFDIAREEAERIWNEDKRLYKKLEADGWDVRNADVLCYELYEPALNKHGWLNKMIRKWKFYDLSDDYGVYWNVHLDLR